MTTYVSNNTAPQNGGALDAWRERINSGRQYPDAWTPRQRSCLDTLLMAKRMHAVRWLHERRAQQLRAAAIASCISRAERVHKLRLVRNVVR
jgi:hypothetical protein